MTNTVQDYFAKLDIKTAKELPSHLYEMRRKIEAGEITDEKELTAIANGTLESVSDKMINAVLEPLAYQFALNLVLKCVENGAVLEQESTESVISSLKNIEPTLDKENNHPEQIVILSGDILLNLAMHLDSEDADHVRCARGIVFVDLLETEKRIGGLLEEQQFAGVAPDLAEARDFLAGARQTVGALLGYSKEKNPEQAFGPPNKKEWFTVTFAVTPPESPIRSPNGKVAGRKVLDRKASLFLA